MFKNKCVFCESYLDVSMVTEIFKEWLKHCPEREGFLFDVPIYCENCGKGNKFRKMYKEEIERYYGDNILFRIQKEGSS